MIQIVILDVIPCYWIKIGRVFRTSTEEENYKMDKYYLLNERPIVIGNSIAI